MKKKTATITFQNADNYGAMLQAYALQKVIISYGCTNTVINYRSDYMSSPWSTNAYINKGIIRYFLGIAYYFIRLARKRKFNQFRSKYLQLTIPINKEDLYKLELNYDLFIAGSDQVWNPDITNYDGSFFLDFVSDEKKKGSYAASFGVDELKFQAKTGFLLPLLKSFSYLNVREEEAKVILNKVINRECSVVLDPCFLLNDSEWNELTRPTKNQKYLLVYQTTFSAYLLNLAQTFAKKYDLTIISIPFPMGKLITLDTNFSAGPIEWLSLFKNAKYIFTDSFHGTVFSIIFNINFFVTITEGGSRITTILKKFGLSSRLVDKSTDIDFCAQIDWESVNKVRNIERNKSLQILKQMLI